MMTRVFIPILLMLLLPLQLSASNHAEGKFWTDYPLIDRMAPFSRGAARLKTFNIRSDSFQVYPSTTKGQKAAKWVVKLEQGQGQFRPAGGKQGAYHLVVAQQTIGPELRIATAVVHFPNPAPPPRQMLAQPKAQLEVVPLKLPREHAHYRAGESWNFLIRHDGKSLAKARVVLETANGTTQVLHADTHGVVRVIFPDDFSTQHQDPEPHAEHRRHPGAAFVLATELKTGKQNIISAFNTRYFPSDWQNKNLWLGAGYAVFGMLMASPLLCRVKRKGAKT